MVYRRFTFSKEERLTGKKSIDLLFKNGIHINKNPLRAIFLIVDDLQKYPARVLFGVSKKKFKRAVKRNIIKRRLRESYRINKYLLYDFLKENKIKIHLAILYEDDKILDFRTIENCLKEIFKDINIYLSRNK